MALASLIDASAPTREQEAAAWVRKVRDGRQKSGAPHTKATGDARLCEILHDIAGIRGRGPAEELARAIELRIKRRLDDFWNNEKGIA